MKPEKFGFGISLTYEGPIFYYFNDKKISMEELLKLEINAFIRAKKEQHHIFELYETKYIDDIIIGLN